MIFASPACMSRGLLLTLVQSIYIFDEKYVDRLTVIIILITHPNHMID